ncbi:MAG TPA: response regulator [Anaerolineae bacterium]|nr:response regulator [Anaerolineae bacterium]HMR68327.1 response regulator [Anaerolineae bacterium]
MDTVKSRILIADPDPDVGETLKLYFSAHGHEVQLVNRAEDVLKAARQSQPSAILMSSEVSDRNPYQVCREILEDKLTGHIPVILMLHIDERQARLEALEAGADDVITKPIDIEELRLRVEAAVRLSTVREYA